ncbi:MAG: MarR family transcriptional regulator [Silicimonas sp.]|nr:MarR family transcriptional regulator [Silicimonas sp.]
MSETRENNDQLAIAIFSEILVADQLARSRMAKALPKGMELSHFAVLNLLARGGEKSPADLAKAFNVTRGAMTNTIGKLEWAGYVHVRPDWDDARRKHVSISPAGARARDLAFSAIAPILEKAVEAVGPEKVRTALPVIRDLRRQLIGE